MGDRMPTPEEFAAAAREVEDARKAKADADDIERNARHEATCATNRLTRAEQALRAMTDRAAPLVNERGRLVG
jgi:hypothetical protein